MPRLQRIDDAKALAAVVDVPVARRERLSQHLLKVGSAKANRLILGPLVACFRHVTLPRLAPGLLMKQSWWIMMRRCISQS